MLFENLLMPDVMPDTFRDVTAQMLTSKGIKYIICDIDNTLVTYDDPKPTEDVLKWFEHMHDNGITVAFVSNNEAERVELFNSDLGFTAYSKARKPLQKKLRAAMAELGADKTNAALLGDQLLTDCMAGKLAGMYVLIVPPIKDKLTLFFRFKRWLEKPYVKKYRRMHTTDYNRQEK